MLILRWYFKHPEVIRVGSKTEMLFTLIIILIYSNTVVKSDSNFHIQFEIKLINKVKM